MMGFEGRLHWRKVAAFHVQIELQKVSMEFQSPSCVEIPGRVIRVFRTDGRLALGDRVAFALWVCRPGDEPTGPAYVYYDDFIRTTHMEVYLHGSPPEYKLAAYEFTLLRDASDEPTMSAAHLEQELRSAVFEKTRLSSTAEKRWWYFWKTKISGGIKSHTGWKTSQDLCLVAGKMLKRM